MSRLGPCMCGACDCPSCGPAQGYTVVRRFVRGRWRYVNPEDDEDGDDSEGGRCDCEPDPPEPDDYAASQAADRYERDIERNYP